VAVGCGVGTGVGTGRDVGSPVVVGSGADSEEHAPPTKSAIASISSGRSFFILEVRLYENNGQ